MSGTPSRTARVSTVRWNLKEAEDKTPIQGTQIWYEAVVRGRGSVDSQSPKTSGTGGRIPGGCGGKVTRLTLGDLLSGHVLGRSEDQTIREQKSAEGIVGRCSDRRPERIRAVGPKSRCDRRRLA